MTLPVCFQDILNLFRSAGLKLLFLFLPLFGFSQNVVDSTLKYPWVGGLNSPQFGKIDINLDGRKDLVIFDRQGNRILPFINNGIPDSVSYTFHPELASLFPPLHDWVFFMIMTVMARKISSPMGQEASGFIIISRIQFSSLNL